jgi:hypothetical protein
LLVQANPEGVALLDSAGVWHDLTAAAQAEVPDDAEVVTATALASEQDGSFVVALGWSHYVAAVQTQWNGTTVTLFGADGTVRWQQTKVNKTSGYLTPHAIGVDGVVLTYGYGSPDVGGYLATPAGDLLPLPLYFQPIGPPEGVFVAGALSEAPDTWGWYDAFSGHFTPGPAHATDALRHNELLITLTSIKGAPAFGVQLPGLEAGIQEAWGMEDSKAADLLLVNHTPSGEALVLDPVLGRAYRVGLGYKIASDYLDLTALPAGWQLLETCWAAPQIAIDDDGRVLVALRTAAVDVAVFAWQVGPAGAMAWVQVTDAFPGVGDVHFDIKEQAQFVDANAWYVNYCFPAGASATDTASARLALVKGVPEVVALTPEWAAHLASPSGRCVVTWETSTRWDSEPTATLRDLVDGTVSPVTAWGSVVFLAP